MGKCVYESDKPSCVVCGTASKNKILFRFPKSPDRQETWKSFAKVQSIKRRSRLCEMHFETDQLVRQRLKKTAIPTVCMKSFTTNPKAVGPPKLIKILPKPR